MDGLNPRDFSTTPKNRRKRDSRTPKKPLILVGALACTLVVIAALMVTVVAVVSGVNNSDSATSNGADTAQLSNADEGDFAKIESALVAIGAPVTDAHVSEAKSGLSSYLNVLVYVDEAVQTVDAPLLKIVATTVARETQAKLNPIVISIGHWDSASLDTDVAANALGFPSSSTSLSGSLTLTHNDLNELVQSWR